MIDNVLKMVSGPTPLGTRLGHPVTLPQTARSSGGDQIAPGEASCAEHPPQQALHRVEVQSAALPAPAAMVVETGEVLTGMF